MESDAPIRPLTVALFDELRPLYPDTPLEHGMASYTVAAAGTYAGVHLLVWGLRAGHAVTIEAGGPHQRYRRAKRRLLALASSSRHTPAAR